VVKEQMQDQQKILGAAIEISADVVAGLAVESAVEPDEMPSAMIDQTSD
jgi:hypothetical protein